MATKEFQNYDAWKTNAPEPPLAEREEFLEDDLYIYDENEYDWYLYGRG